MKTTYLTVSLLLVAIAGGAQTSYAACACMCVEGSQRTLCNDINEAGAGQNACITTAIAELSCPEPNGTIDTTVTDPIPEGAENCLVMRLYDPNTGDYTVSKNLCEVAS